MFSQRKRFYQRKSFYGIILALLLAFGFWVNQDPADRQSEGEQNGPVVSTGENVPGTNSGAGSRQPADSGSDPYTGHSGSGYSPYGTEGRTEGEPGTGGYESDPAYGQYGDPDSSQASGRYGADSYDGGGQGDGRDSEIEGPCYLVKEDGGYIKIYSVDQTGARQLVRTTDISFSLLSESDQELFQKGIVKETQDELSDLLQDFES